MQSPNIRSNLHTFFKIILIFLFFVNISCQICKATYKYNEQTGPCYRDCTQLAGHGVDPTIVFPYEANRCVCIDPTRRYNFQQQIAECQSKYCIVPNYILATSTQCNCTTSFEQPKLYKWNVTQRYCFIDCSLIQNTDPSHTRFNSSSCICLPKYKWQKQITPVNRRLLAKVGLVNLQYGACVLDCYSIPHTVTPPLVPYPPIVTSCECKKGYTWNQDTLSCDSLCPAGLNYVIDYTTDIVGCQRACDPVSHPYATGVDPNNLNQCVCQSDFIWNPTTSNCQRDCTPNTVDPYSTGSHAVGDITKCSCSTGFVWNIGNARCQRDCSRTLIPHSTGSNTQTIDQCSCDLDFIWNTANSRCQRDCTPIIADPFATGLNTQSIDQCTCATGLIWSLCNSRCQRDCTRTTVPQSLGLNTYSIDQCLCGSDFIWNTANSRCERDCTPNTADPYSTSLDTQNANQCLCANGLVWNSCLARCQRNCDQNTDQYSAGLNTQSINQCLCETDFVWSATANKCQRDCTANTVDPFSNGLDTLNTDRCLCVSGLNWNSLTARCERNCDRSTNPYSVGLNANYIDQCLCDSDFNWNPAHSKCQRDCTVNPSDPFSAGLNTQSVDQCSCPSGLIWNAQKARCERNCDRNANPYSTGLNTNSINQCLCDSDFVWSPTTNKCQRDCTKNTADPFAVALNSQFFDQCTCPAGLIWSTCNARCERDCARSTTPYSLGLNTNSIDQCLCDPDFVWSATNARCERDCSRNSADPYASGPNPQNTTQCLCDPNLNWNPFTQRCQRNCSYQSDGNATRINSLNWSTCDCKKDYLWDFATSLCKPTTTVLSCNCPDNLIWSNYYLSCIRNCSADPNAVGLYMDNKTQCICKVTLFKTYVWSLTYKKCVPYCPIGMQWNDALKICTLCLLGSSQPTLSSNQDSESNGLVTVKSYALTQQEQNQIIVQSEHKTTAIIVLGCLLGVFMVIIVGLSICLYKKRESKRQQDGDGEKKPNSSVSMKSINDDKFQEK